MTWSASIRRMSWCTGGRRRGALAPFPDRHGLQADAGADDARAGPYRNERRGLASLPRRPLCLDVLDVLDDVANGVDRPRVVGKDAAAYGWEALRDKYSGALGV